MSITQFAFPGLLVKHISGFYGLLTRKLAVECYVIFKLLIPVLIFKFGWVDNCIVPVLIFYLLTETVLYLATLIFLSNEFAEPISYRRSLTYLFINFIEIVLDFAVLYAYYNIHISNFFSKKLTCGTDAIYFSFVTSATVGYGDYSPENIFAKRLVIFQIILFFVFVGLFLNFFASRIQDPTYYNNKKKKSSSQY